MRPADPTRLIEEVPPVSMAEWEAAIHANLKGADYDRRLVWKSEEGITVRPHYLAEDSAGLNPYPFARRGWKMVEPGSAVPANALRGDLIR